VTGRWQGWIWRSTAEYQTRRKSSRRGAHWMCNVLLRRILPINTNVPSPQRTSQTDAVLSGTISSRTLDLSAPKSWTRGTDDKTSTKWVVSWMTLDRATLMVVQRASRLVTFSMRPSNATDTPIDRLTEQYLAELTRGGSMVEAWFPRHGYSWDFRKTDKKFP